jgi:hypothetical protein
MSRLEQLLDFQATAASHRCKIEIARHRPGKLTDIYLHTGNSRKRQKGRPEDQNWGGERSTRDP